MFMRLCTKITAGPYENRAEFFGLCADSSAPVGEMQWIFWVPMVLHTVGFVQTRSESGRTRDNHPDVLAHSTLDPVPILAGKSTHLGRQKVGARGIEDRPVRSGNVHALGSGASLEDKAVMTDEEVRLEGLILILLVGRVHEVDELVCSL